MTQFKKTFVLVIVLSLFCFPLGFTEANHAGQAGAFLGLGVGARANAMGNAYTGLSDDASAVYWNPAGLSFLSHAQLMGMYSSISMDRYHNFIALVIPKGKTFCIGVGWIAFGVSNIDGRDFTGNTTGKFNDSENAFLLSLSKRIGAFSFGGSAKYLRHSLADKSANGFSFDIGLKVKLTDFISVGVTSRNILGKLTWNTDSEIKETIPHKECIGVAISPDFLPIIVASDISLNSEKNPFHLGVEYHFLKLLAARVGYNSGNLTFGGAVQIDTGIMNVQLNYALSQDVLGEGATNRISLILEF